ncbi:MAG: tail fiber domain-containing protein, partial [Chitinivibrionales bacterium]|nr:tail fiber domain-containing protein [Chitinivibrionales bacterium]
ADVVVGSKTNSPLSIKTNNTTAMTLLPSGNVGIGTSTPVAGLQVEKEGAGSADGTLLLVNSANANFGGNATIAGIKSARGDAPTYALLNIQNSAGSKMYVRGDGNVGIGTSSPSNKLHLLETTVTPAIKSESSSSFSGIDFKNTGGTIPQEWIIGSDGTGVIGGGLAFYSQDSLKYRMVINSAGTVGIGTTTPSSSYVLYVNGAAGGTGSWNSVSDRRYKTSITPIDSSLTKISKLQGVYYDWDRAKWPKKNFPEGKQVGLIAQDVEKVIPEVVNTDKEGYKSLSYDKLTAVLIEAVKELKAQNQGQQEQVQKQQEEIALLKRNIELLEKK